ncbi:hypothetical protein [Pseudotabrizicola alkalilacus]|uniref:hypothetical protein n=1 Tax=Pseudotabrizicola alkalilacus TaxID=2305252 RepID=UPI001314885B|nr:hypothetical protein [Pseudotabrizicola alkalilacus]
MALAVCAEGGIYSLSPWVRGMSAAFATGSIRLAMGFHLTIHPGSTWHRHGFDLAEYS